MKLSVYDQPAGTMAGQRGRLAKMLEGETCFGVSAHFRHPRNHAVMDEDWSVSPITRQMRDKAWEPAWHQRDPP